MHRLEGKVCLVSGASRGLGRAVAIEFARQGASLVINSRPSSAKDLAETELRLSVIGAPVLRVSGDVSQRTWNAWRRKR
jgi:3-oxoacyl-[acyl-carrier protein] reductase